MEELYRSKPEDADFHKKRIMFLIMFDGIIKDDSNRSHSEWFVAEEISTPEDLPKFMKTHIRGCIYKYKVYFYKGKFTYDKNLIKYVKDNRKRIKQSLGQKDFIDLHMFAGPPDTVIHGKRYKTEVICVV